MTQTLDTIRVIGINDGGAAETVIATSKPCSSSPNRGINPVVRISGGVSITPGPSTTGLTVRVRQNDINGQIFGTSVIPVTAGITNFVPIYALDATGVSEQGAGAIYVITIIETGATGAGLLSVSAAIESLT